MMQSLVKKSLLMLKKCYYLALRYLCVYWARIFSFIKVKLRGCKTCGVRKNMEKTYSRLGAEIYSLHRQGLEEWEKNPMVRQQLKIVEEAESEVFREDEVIEGINKDFERRKAEIIEKYTTLRAELDKSDTEN